MNDASTVGSIGAQREGDTTARPANTRPSAHAAADRHSRRVRFFKIVLPVFGVAALALVGGLTWFKMQVFSGVDMRNVLFSKDGLTMVEPRLSGRTQGRTYDVTAARAFQSIADPKVVRLEGIDGRLELSDGTSVKIDSAEGTYDGHHETLRLQGGIALAASNGWRAEGPSADVDLVGGRVTGRDGVRITGPTATIAADSLDLTDNGHHALFEGRVRMTILPAAADPATEPLSAPIR